MNTILGCIPLLWESTYPFLKKKKKADREKKKINLILSN